MRSLVDKVLQEILLNNQLLTRKENEMILNSLMIMGNLTRDPQIKNTPLGKEVCSFSIANNFIHTKNGEKITEVSYFDVEVWGAAGENCFKYLTKGSGIILEGRLRQERWEKDGKSQSRVKITANNVHFLPRRQKNSTALDSSIPSNEGDQTDLLSKEVVMTQ